MSETIFYTQVDGSVVKALNARKAYYNAEERGEGAHSWLHRKMAFATANAQNTNAGRSASLAISRKGGLKKGLYNATPSDKGSFKYIPKPHITSIKISAEGDFGSTRTCELAFTVYSITDLDAKQPFFDLGADIGLTWGWSDAGGAGGPDGRFQGKIYNFTYSVNQQGGFDCVTYGMEEGINILSGNANAPTKEGEAAIDKLGNELVTNTILAKVQKWVLDAGEMTEGITPEGLGVVQYPSDWGTEPTAVEGETPPDAPSGQPEAQFYVSLEAIVKQINTLALENDPKSFGKDGIGITCDATVTKGLVPTDVTRLVSADPVSCLFPGYGKYSDDRNFSFAEYDSAFMNGDLSKTMISMKWFEAAFAKLGQKDDKTGKSPDSSIATFLQDIFSLIFKCSGDRFKLTTVSKPKSKSGTEILIVDANYIDTDNVTPYKFTAVDQTSIVRSMSLTAKVPSAMASTAMIANQSGFTSNRAPNPGGKGQKGEAQGRVPETLEKAKKNLATQFVTPATISALEAALRRDQTGESADNVNGKEAIPFPLDFSVTIDGVEGIVFGNVVTSNYLPAVYTKSKLKIGFTVTTVSHTITAGDWTTTINTVCRIIS
jgi:hypothetical protein